MRNQHHRRTSLPPQMTEHQIKQCAAWQSAISFGHFMNGIIQDGNGHPEKHKGVNLTQAMDDELRKVHGKLFANNKEYETPATSVFDEHFDVEHAIEENIQKDLARIARWHELPDGMNSPKLVTSMRCVLTQKPRLAPDSYSKTAPFRNTKPTP